MNKNHVSSKISTSIKILCLLVTLASCQESLKSSSQQQEAEDKSPKSGASGESQKKQKNTFPTLDTEAEAIEFLKDYQPQVETDHFVINTDFGQIEVELYKNTPIHRKNILYLIDRSYFDGTWFHRVSAEHVIQAGNNDEYDLVRLRKEIGAYKLSPEALGENYHSYGAVAMARSYKNNPNKLSDPFEFYISLGPKYSLAQLRALETEYDMTLNPTQLKLYQEQGGSPHLDGEHTVIGRVVKGMSVVEAISKVKTDEGEWPIKNIPISLKLKK